MRSARGVSHHTSRPGVLGGNSEKAMRQHPPFLKARLAWRPAPMSRRASSLRPGSCPTNRVRFRSGYLASKAITASADPSGPKVSENSTGQRLREYLRGFLGPSQRTRNNPVHSKFHPPQSLSDLLRPLPALRSQGTLGIVGIACLSALHRLAVPHDVKLILCLRRLGVRRGINRRRAIFFHFDHRSCVGGGLFSGLWPPQHQQPPRSLNSDRYIPTNLGSGIVMPFRRDKSSDNYYLRASAWWRTSIPSTR